MAVDPIMTVTVDVSQVQAELDRLNQQAYPILKRLLAINPIRDAYDGMVYTYCVFCDAVAPDRNGVVTHAPDCPYVEAVRLLGESSDAAETGVE